MSNFGNYKKFENVGIRSSNDTLIVMDSSNNNISLHSSDGGDDNVDTLSIKNIINKTPNMDLNLSSLNGTTINPVITINNNHGDCRIKTNLNVIGNLNIIGNGIINTSVHTNSILDINGQTTIRGHILPSQNSQFDLGNSEYKIRHLFLSDNSLWVGEEHKIDISNGKIKFKKRNKAQAPRKLDNTPISVTDVKEVLSPTRASQINTNADVKLSEWYKYADSIGIGTSIFTSNDSNIWTEDKKEGAGTVSIGGIIMWSGTAVPQGWALCDGNNGTPDLRDKFIVGAGYTYAIGNTGGANTVSLSVSQIPSHNHSISIGSTSHSHSGTTSGGGGHSHTTGDSGHITAAGRGGHKTWRAAGYHGLGAGSTSSEPDHTHSFTTDPSSHSHSASVGNTGSGSSHENRPPYYALIYIMRIQ